jgi:hypothetical protein
MNKLTQWLLLVLLTLTSASTAHQVVAEGIGGSGRVVGPVGRFGSVVIDGVHYDTSSAAIRINGESAHEHDLRVGNRVLIVGDLDAAVADEVHYFDTVAGPLQALTLEDETLGIASLTVMGQQVLTDADTWVHGTSLGSLAIGSQLAVSGTRLSDGTVRASSLERVSRPLQVVSGTIGSLDDGQFAIGSLTIVAGDVEGAFADGDFVYVLGYYLGDNALHAVTVAPMGTELEAQGEARLEGALKLDDNGWSVEGVRLILEADTAYLAGKNEDLAPGAQVAVRGDLGSDGALRVRTMEFEEAALSRIDGPIGAVAADGSSITVNDVVIEVDASLSMLDRRDGYRWFAPADLAHHDRVSVMVEERDGRVVASRLLRKHSLRKMLKSRISNGGWAFEGVTALRATLDIEEAREARIDGVQLSADLLKWYVRDGDALHVEFDEDGGIDTVAVVTEQP